MHIFFSKNIIFLLCEDVNKYFIITLVFLSYSFHTPIIIWSCQLISKKSSFAFDPVIYWPSEGLLMLTFLRIWKQNIDGWFLSLCHIDILSWLATSTYQMWINKHEGRWTNPVDIGKLRTSWCSYKVLLPSALGIKIKTFHACFQLFFSGNLRISWHSFNEGKVLFS